jgi:tRNA-(ms[2]io[6]A)-hydroxylase
LNCRDKRAAGGDFGTHRRPPPSEQSLPDAALARAGNGRCTGAKTRTKDAAMLSLKSRTPDRWLAQILPHLDELLIDHAHCEKKAAGVAMNLIFAYVEHEELARALSEIVREELEHFNLVLDKLAARKIRFRRLAPSSYGRLLNELVRKTEPGRAIDRMIVAGLIEARSCERFGLLGERLGPVDPDLAAFFSSLFESEARHHTTYIKFAKLFGSDEEIVARLDELAGEEARILEQGDPFPRMHS